MEKIYNELEIEVITIGCDDVITTSPILLPPHDFGKSAQETDAN